MSEPAQHRLFDAPPEEPCASCGALPSNFPADCPYEPVPLPWEHAPGEPRPKACIVYDPDRSPIPF